MCVVKKYEEAEKQILLTKKDGNVVAVGSTKVFEDKGECWAKALDYVFDADDVELSDIDSLHCKLINNEKDTVYLTQHAVERMKERNGWNEKTSFRMAAKIHDKGIDLANASMGYLSQWAKRKKSRTPELDFIMYGDYVYVFTGSVLLTSEIPPTRTSVLRSFRNLKNSKRTKERHVKENRR